jgi:xanthine dehydrogenase YagT iron-sulfur-binding subunit
VVEGKVLQNEASTVKINITIGDTVLPATLNGSTAAQDFASLLPLSLTLEDYASTEKISDLPKRLSTEGAPRGSDPSVGDLAYYAPWGNLAVFYRDFGYSSGLVLLGTVDSGIEALARPGPLDVKIELAERSDIDLTRRELLKLTAAAGGVMVAGPLMPWLDASAAGEDSEAEAVPIAVLLRVNGVEQRLTLDPRTTLLDALREHLNLHGTKKGCALGQCGACTVLLDGKRVKSCLSLAALVDGREITTIEGLAQGDQLHPLQTAFIERDAFQCGYCTSGQIMAGVACIAEGHAGSAQEIRDWMSGNLCRCGAYDHIVAAIQDAAGTTKATGRG